MVVLGIVLAVSAGACGSTLFPNASPTQQELAREALGVQQQVWNSKGITDYEFSLTKSCFCPDMPTYRVTVVDGVVSQVTVSRVPVDPAEVKDLPKTIPELFALVHALPADQALAVMYDPDWGFPQRIDVDPIPNAVDDEYTIAAVAFKPISVPPGATPAS
ncbi:MAG TPA: DUF6174 domain-containing protein [Candidatus Limnocylindrales bacterium]|nr:DUF6174 domain-containing protein [Candidatus Limnocylindrales bacterium]